jgi:tetratricopeptide (TPR) repeat protein
MVRASKSNPLPNAPLELSDPVSLPEGDVAGAEVMAELGPEHAVLLFRVLRITHAWAADAGASGWYDADVLRSLEEEVLTGGIDEHLRSAVAVLLGELVDPAATDVARLSLCCLQICEWAKERGAAKTSLAFSRAAALVWPTNGALAYLAGRRYRSAGQMKEADLWLRRAARVALWYSDWETYARVLTSLGTTAYRQGDYPLSRAYLDRALRVADRHGLRTLAGEIYHDRFTVAYISEEKRGAEEFARAALERYLPFHERLRALEYDFAYYWLTRGYAAKALDALRALLPHFPQPAHRLQVVSASTRAAGALGDRAAFDEFWAAAWTLMAELAACAILPAAVLDLGYGAGHVQQWEHAETAFQRAREISRATEQPEDERLAGAALAAVGRRENPDPLCYRFMQEKG